MLAGMCAFVSPAYYFIVYQDNLNLICLFDFRLKPIFATALAVLKIIAHFKNGQKCVKNNNLTTIAKV